MALGDLVVKVGAQIDDFKSKMAEVVTTANTTADEVENAFAPFAEFGKNLAIAGAGLTAAITAPLVGLGEASLKAAGDMEQARIAFTTMIGSAKEAQSFLNDLVDFAIKTPFEIPGLVDASKKLLAFGFDAKELLPMLTNIGDAAAALGKGAEGIDRITLAFGEMRARGTVAMKEMNQLAMNGIPALEILAEKMDMSTADLMKKIKARMIDAADAIPMLLEGINDKFGGMMAAQATTMMGMWSNLKDAMTKTFIAIGDTIAPYAKSFMAELFPVLDQVRQLAVAFGELSEPTKVFALSLAGMAAALGPIMVALGGLSIAVSAIGPALTAIAGVFGVSVAALGAWAAGIAVVTAALVALGVWVNANWEPIKATLLQAFDGIGDLWQAQLAAVSTIFQAVFGDIIQQVQDFNTTFLAAFTEIDNGVQSFNSGIIDAFKGLLAFVGEELSPIFQPVVEAWTQAWEYAKLGWGQLVDWFHQGLQAIGDWARNDAVFGPLIAGFEKLSSLADTWKQKSAELAHNNYVADQAKQMMDAYTSANQAANKFWAAQEQARLKEAAAAAKEQADIDKTAEKQRAAYDAMNKRYDDLAKASVELPAKMQLIDEQATITGLKLQEAFNKGADAIRRVAETVVEVGDTTKSSWDNLLDRLPDKVAEIVDRTKTELEYLKKDFADLGVTPDSAYQSDLDRTRNHLAEIEAIYSEHGKNLTAINLVTQNELDKARIAAHQKEIDDLRALGQEVSDQLIINLEHEKTLYAQMHIDLAQAFQQAGISAADSLRQQADLTETALQRIQRAYEQGNATIGDVNRAMLAQMKDNAAAMIAAGETVPAAYKQQMDRLEEIVKNGNLSIKTTFENFTYDLGKSLTKGFDQIWTDLLTGQKSFMDALKSLWKDIASSIVKDFLHPVDQAIGDFLSGAIHDLLGGKGFGGLIDQAKTLGTTIKDVFSSASTAASGAVKDISYVSDGVPLGQLPTGQVSDAAGAASSGASGGGASSGLGGISGITNMVTGAVSAISSVVGNFQFAHMNTALGRIEESTRYTKIYTGEQADSILKTLHDIREYTDDTRNRVAEIRPALFDPIAHDLESIYNVLVDILHATTGTQDATEAMATTSTEVVQAVTDGTDAVAEATQTVADTITQTTDAVTSAVTDGAENITAATFSGATAVATTDAQGSNNVTDAVLTGSGAIVQATAMSADEVRAKLDDLGSVLVDGFYNTTAEYDSLKQTLIGKPMNGDTFAGVSPKNGWTPGGPLPNPYWTTAATEPAGKNEGPATGSTGTVTNGYATKPGWTNAYGDTTPGAANADTVSAIVTAPAADVAAKLTTDINQAKAQYLDWWNAIDQAAIDAQQKATDDAAAALDKQAKDAAAQLAQALDEQTTAHLNAMKSAIFDTWAKDPNVVVRRDANGNILSVATAHQTGTDGASLPAWANPMGFSLGPNGTGMSEQDRQTAAIAAMGSQFTAGTNPFTDSIANAIGGSFEKGLQKWNEDLAAGLSQISLGKAPIFDLSDPDVQAYLQQYMTTLRGTVGATNADGSATTVNTLGGMGNGNATTIQLVLQNAVISGPQAYQELFRQFQQYLAGAGIIATS